MYPRGEPNAMKRRGCASCAIYRKYFPGRSWCMRSADHSSRQHRDGPSIRIGATTRSGPINSLARSLPLAVRRKDGCGESEFKNRATCGGHAPTAERTLDPARIIGRELDPRPGIREQPGSTEAHRRPAVERVCSQPTFLSSSSLTAPFWLVNVSELVSPLCCMTLIWWSPLS